MSDFTAVVVVQCPINAGKKRSEDRDFAGSGTEWFPTGMCPGAGGQRNTAYPDCVID
jgi:hypothetical protein